MLSSVRQTLYIHFGQHKTGSTAIQHLMQQACLDNPKYTYITAGPHANASMLVRSTFSSKLPAGEKKRAYALFKQLLKSVQTEIGILSAEFISHLRGAELSLFLKLCRECYPQLRLIGYIRSPLDFVRSALQETIKIRNPGNLYLKNPVFSFLRELVTQVKLSDISVFSYDECVAQVGDIVQHFASTVGIKLKSENLKTKRNETLCLTSVKFLYIYRTILCADDNLISAGESRIEFLTKVAFISGEAFRLGEKIADKIHEQNTEDMNWAFEVFGNNFEGKSQASSDGINTLDELLDLSVRDLELLDKLSGGVLPDLAVGSVIINAAAAMHILRMSCHRKSSSLLQE